MEDKSKIDITTFTSIKNTAALHMVNIMTENGDHKLLDTAISTITSMNKHLKEIYDLGCYNTFYYDLIYDHYKRSINENSIYSDIYKSYIINVLHARNKEYNDKVKQEINRAKEIDREMMEMFGNSSDSCEDECVIKEN
jgi:hypothetical protein